MTFDSVQHMLLWFFNRLWIKPPKEPGNHDPIYIQHGSMMYDTREVWETVHKITKVIEGLPARDRGVVQELFTRHKDISDVAKRMKLTERRLRQIRQRTIMILKIRCLNSGIICKSKYETPVYL